MSRREWFVGAWIFSMLLFLVSAAQAEISAINPEHGTVGTQIKITGTGFGYQTGKVLLGQEKCKVLAWDNTEITCEVTKPQHPGTYVISVHPADKKKTDELPIASYPYFTMRQPELFPGDLVRDGDTVTVEGAFLGDKKGEVRLALPGNETVFEKIKIVDWNSDTISFELPDWLMDNTILVVINDVGAGFARLNIEEDKLEPWDGATFTPPGEYREDAGNGSSGVMFNGQFFIFSINEDNIILARTYNIGTRQMSPPLALPEIKTFTIPKPLVVGDKLFVFINEKVPASTSGKLSYVSCIFNQSDQTYEWSSLKQILDLRSPDVVSPAPVYNPVLDRIEVYYNKNYWDKGYIRWAYSDDSGATWQEIGTRGDVDNLTPVGLQNAPGAVYFNHPIYGPSTLLAVKNSHSNNDGIVYVLRYGSVVGAILNFGKFGDSAPSLVDLGPDYIALLYPSDENDPVIRLGQSQVPMFRRLDKSTLQWTDPIQAVDMPTLDSSGYNYFIFQPSDAVGCYPNTSGGYDRRLYLFFGYLYWPFIPVQDSNPTYQQWVLLRINDELFTNLGTCP